MGCCIASNAKAPPTPFLMPPTSSAMATPPQRTQLIHLFALGQGVLPKAREGPLLLKGPEDLTSLKGETIYYINL